MKPVLKNTNNLPEKSSALAKSIFSESSENDSENLTLLSKRKGKKNQQSAKPGSKKGRSPSPPSLSSQTKKGSNKTKGTVGSTSTVIKTEVTTFGPTKGSDVTASASPKKTPGRGRPPKMSAAKMAAEAASKKVT